MLVIWLWKRQQFTPNNQPHPDFVHLTVNMAKVYSQQSTASSLWTVILILKCTFVTLGVSGIRLHKKPLILLPLPTICCWCSTNCTLGEVQQEKHNGTRPRKEMAAEKEEAFQYVHSELLLSLGRCLFSNDVGIGNSCRILHLWPRV